MFRIAIAAAVTLTLAFCSRAALAQEKAVPIELVKDGKSDYVVLIHKDAGPSEKWAAKDFVDHIKKMSGAELKITDASEIGSVPDKAIIIGGLNPDPNGGEFALPDEEYGLTTNGSVLHITGGRLRGTMYGVYTLLDKLGCRWWYPGASTIPQTKNITIPPLLEAGAPVFEYRDYLYNDVGDDEAGQLFRARNRINGGFYKSLDAKYGGVYTFDTLVHSYGRLMPEAKYFSAHPEYYAMVNGKRQPTQPCFSNPEVPKIMAAELIKEIGEHPEWRFVTVGQNDNRGYCQCDECKKLAEKYGLSGMQLSLAKEVGKLVREKYPDMHINVPAYEWSRKPPIGGLKPDDKGLITLCSIECNFGQPLEEGWPKENESFKADIVGWGDLAPKLLIWDYTTDFVHYILPFPNYYSLAANVKFFADHKARGYMAQGSHTTKHGQFAPLCIWVLSRALWDPNQDGKKLVEEFCLGYYGPQAGKIVLEYANLLAASVNGENRQPVWATHRTFLSAPYLTPELMAKGDALFRQAEAAVKDNPDLLKRVQADHVPVLYVIVKRCDEMMPAIAKASPGVTIDHVFKEFATFGKQAGIAREAEGGDSKPLFEWALEYGPKKAKDAKFDWPEEAKKAGGAACFLQAAQIEQGGKFLQKADGASDGWALRVPGVGWSIQHHFTPPAGVDVGKTYRLFVRAKATAGQGATTALTTGIHTKEPPRTCSRTVKAAEASGQWQVYDAGPWTPTKDGGSFWIATGPTAIADAFIDCLWLVEQEKAATAPAPK